MIGAWAAKPPPLSTDVTIIAWLGLISGFFAFVNGGALLMLAPGFQALALMAGGIIAMIAAFGLRRRREWARRSFIGVQALAIVNIAVRAFTVQRAMSARLAATGLTADDLRSAATSMRNTQIVIALVFAAINGLIIARLCSAKVRAEFEANE